MKESANVISVEAPTKRYGSSRGVEDLTFEVRAGDAGDDAVTLALLVDRGEDE